MTGPDASTQDTHPTMTTHPLLGAAGVLLGPLTASTSRLMNVGSADIRGALHLGVDEGSWINSALNISMMGRAAKALGRRFASSHIPWQSLQLSSSATFCVACPVVVSSMSQGANTVLAGHCCATVGQRSTLHEREQSMTSDFAARRELRAAARLCLPLALLGSTLISTSVAQQTSAK